MTLEDYTLKVENEEGLALELNLRLTMLTWRHLSLDSGMGLDELTSDDPMKALDGMAWTIASAVKTYDAKYGTKQVCSFEDAYELLPLMSVEEINNLGQAINDSKMIKSLTKLSSAEGK